MPEPGTVDSEFQEVSDDGAFKKESHSLYDHKLTPNREETNNDRVLRDLEIKKLKRDENDRIWRRCLQIAELLALIFIFFGVRAMLDLKAKSDSRDQEWTRRTLQLDSFSLRQEQSVGRQLKGLSSLGRIEAKQDSILEGKRRPKVPETKVIVSIPDSSLHKQQKN